MESEKVLTGKILQITMEIQENYPELSKYLVEMTDTIPDEKHPEINIKNLETYYESLLSMVKKYTVDHEIPTL